MEEEAKLVIIGAGIVGCSAAYHLAEAGWEGIVVVDQGPLFHTGGSTSHAPGLVFQTNSSKMMTRFAQYTIELMGNLEHEAGPCFYSVGGIEVAHTAQRWEDLKRKLGWAQSYGLQAQLLDPDQVAEYIPIIDKEQIFGGYYVPSDGDADALRVCEAMASRAKEGGRVQFYGDTKVRSLEVEDSEVVGVETDRGRIKADQVLLCTNIWAPVLGRTSGVNLPLMAVQHQYAITTPLEELAGERREIVHPILRHQDYSMYFRQHADSYGIGSYHHEPLLVEPRDLKKTAMKPFSPGDFQGAWQAAVELLPALEGKELVESFNGMFAFTTDGMPILGPAPGFENLWVAVGVWVTHAGGVGKAIADWMVEGQPGLDVREADINRFHMHNFTDKYIHARCEQQYREVYDIIHPKQQIEFPRGLRVSPFHHRLAALEAEFFESSGWERPQWFKVNGDRPELEKIPARQGWEARYWSTMEGVEHLGTRQSLGMYDLTAFTKIMVQGPGALDLLNYLAANDVDQTPGKVVYTSLLTPNGGIKADLTITRLAEETFLVLTGGGMGLHDLAWIQDHAPGDGSVTIRDMTSVYCAIGFWGPNARKALQPLCGQDLAHDAFPYFSARMIDLGEIPVLAVRVSYVGELGWELYTPPDYGLRLWDLLWESAEPLGGVAGGGGAFDSLRLEKGYRLWGADIHTDYNPFEAGLGWAVDLEKGDFLGREALMEIQERGIERKLCCLRLAEPGTVVMGKEPVVAGERVLGYVTSANYGYTVGFGIAYAYLPLAFTDVGTEVAIRYFNHEIPAVVAEEPLYDPAMEKLLR